jgi:hypothetical protein
MSSGSVQFDRADPDEAAVNGRVAVVRLGLLLGLGAWAFRTEVEHDLMFFRNYSESSFVLTSPVVLGLMVLGRWKLLSERVGRGSVWGVGLMLLGFGMLAAGIWPYRYGYLRHVAMVPVAAGAIWASCGRRVLVLCLPMLLWFWLSIPIAQRIYQRLIVVPETVTLAAGRAMLDMIPDVAVELDGPDLSYIRRGGGAGTIAAAEPHRGASLLLTYIAVGVFVAFVTIRPFWQVAVLGAASVGIALVCNLARLLMWGVVTIYGAYPPVSAAPRGAAAAVSICLAYLMFVGLSWLMNNLVTDAGDDGGDEIGVNSSTLEAD